MDFYVYSFKKREIIPGEFPLSTLILPYEGGGEDGEDDYAGAEEDVSDVGPQQVERGHLDGDQKYRVDGFLDGGPYPTDLEDAVLGYDFHGNVGVRAVGE